MELAEFDKTSFAAGMTCIHNGVKRRIASVDFPERLLGLVSV